MKSAPFRCYLFLILAVSCWGFSFIFTKSLLNDITPVALIFFRLLIATPLLIAFCRLFSHQSIRHIPAKDWLNLVALSLFEPFLYFLFETYSLQQTDATIVAVIIATIPIFTVFLSVIYFKENLSALNVLGVFVSVIGVTVMLLPEFANSNFRLRGILAAFGAVLASVGYSFFLRRLENRYHAVFIVTCQNSIGLLMFLLLLFCTHNLSEIRDQFVALSNVSTFLNISALAVFCSSIAFILYVVALQKVGLGRANAFTNVIPIVTAICAYFVLNEQFTIYKIVGTCVVILGVCGVQYPKKQQLIHR